MKSTNAATLNLYNALAKEKGGQLYFGHKIIEANCLTALFRPIAGFGKPRLPRLTCEPSRGPAAPTNKDIALQHAQGKR
jgi:hypothetical protein